MPSAAAHRLRGPALQFLGSLFFTGFLFSWTFLYAIPFVIICAFLPFRRRFALARAMARAVLWVLNWSCRLDYRVEGASASARAITSRCGSTPRPGKPSP